MIVANVKSFGIVNIKKKRKNNNKEKIETLKQAEIKRKEEIRKGEE